MTEPPGDFIVLVPFLGIGRLGCFVKTDAGGEHRWIVRIIGPSSQLDRGHRPSMRADLDDAAARGQIVVEMDPDQIGAGWQVAKREPPVFVRDGECGGRSERRDDSSRQRLAQLVFDDAIQIRRA